MAMLRLIARDSGWLTLLPAVVVQDEAEVRRAGDRSQIAELQERFYAITTAHRHRMELLEQVALPARTKARARGLRQRRRLSPPRDGNLKAQ